MATYAHSTPMSAPSPSRRRALFGGAAAAIIGSGITAGAAASVADLVPGETDAELIALCTQYDRLEQRRQDVANSVRTVEQEKAADLIWKELYTQHEPILNRMCAVPATTTAGIAALAASLKLWDCDLYVDEDDPNAPANERLTAALLRSALAGRA